MGTTHSSGSESSKLPLADRRYRVSGARAAALVQRRSTRKLGSVTVELKQPQNGSSEKVGTSAAGQFRHPAADDSDSSDDDKEDGEGEEGNGKLQGTKDANNSTNANNHQEEFEKQQRKISRQRRRLENFQLTRTENPANSAILLTRTQRVLIENCWKRAKKGATEGGIGARVFHTVLIAQPDIKLLFGLEKVPQGRLKYEGQFRRHAGLLNRALDYIVKNLQYTDKLGHHFQALGKKHCQMNGGRAFPSHYWDAFLECITQSVLECDGASGGRQHRCRETAMAWRSLISFIVQQMRRGFEDERLMRKRFSASLMGLRGVTSSNASLLNAAYGGGTGSERGSRLISGHHPRLSAAHQHHTHGSLGSLDGLPNNANNNNSGGGLPPSLLNLSCPYGGSGNVANSGRGRAASAISPLAIIGLGGGGGQQQRKGGSICQSSEDEPSFSGTGGHLLPQTGTSPSNSSSARSASWCAEVNGDHLRRLQISGGGGGCDGPPRTARSELNVDNNSNEGNEVFYTPRMGRNEVARKESSRKEAGKSAENVDCCPPPRPALAAVQLLLNAANSSSEGQMLDVQRPATAGIMLTRHSFSEWVVDGGNRERERKEEQQPGHHGQPGQHRQPEPRGPNAEKAVAVEASRRLLGMAQAHMLLSANAADGGDGDTSPTQLRRLSAL